MYWPKIWLSSATMTKSWSGAFWVKTGIWRWVWVWPLSVRAEVSVTE